MPACGDGSEAAKVELTIRLWPAPPPRLTLGRRKQAYGLQLLPQISQSNGGNGIPPLDIMATWEEGRLVSGRPYPFK